MITHPTPRHTAPTWVKNTYLLSVGEVPLSSFLFQSMLEKSGEEAAGETRHSSRMEEGDSEVEQRYHPSYCESGPFVGSLQDFEAMVQQVSFSSPLLVIFHGSRLSHSPPDWQFMKRSRWCCRSVVAFSHPEIAALYDIRYLPTCLEYRNGILVGRVEGGDEEDIHRLILKLPPAAEEGGDGSSLREGEKV